MKHNAFGLLMVFLGAASFASCGGSAASSGSQSSAAAAPCAKLPFLGSCTFNDATGVCADLYGNDPDGGTRTGCLSHGSAWSTSLCPHQNVYGGCEYPGTAYCDVEWYPSADGGTPAKGCLGAGLIWHDP